MNEKPGCTRTKLPFVVKHKLANALLDLSEQFEKCTLKECADILKHYDLGVDDDIMHDCLNPRLLAKMMDQLGIAYVRRKHNAQSANVNVSFKAHVEALTRLILQMLNEFGYHENDDNELVLRAQKLLKDIEASK